MFTCSADVYDGSALDVQWKRLGLELPSKSSYSTKVLSSGVTTSTLVVPNVTAGDVGIYYCLVWNKRKGAQSNSAYLSLAGLLEVYQCYHFKVFIIDTPSQPWVVTTSPKIVLTTNNFNLSMKCMPESNLFQYTWQKENKNLPSRSHGVTSSTLIITNLRPEDSGNYRCRLSNSTGEISSHYIKISVQGTVYVSILIYNISKGL